MAGQIDARLAELGIELPTPTSPVANYLPYVQTGKILFIAGQVTLWNGERRFVGKLGATMETKQGQEAAKLCALNLIAQAKAACGGDLDRVVRWVKLGGFVNCTPDFGEQPAVVNGASDLLVQVFGDKGKHARAAVGVAALPFGVAVEIDAVIEIS
jgi:enamine deaminase RidA (YjgF/YER057c/UK114 family)